MTDAPPKAPARRWRQPLAIAVVAVLVVALALYGARRTLARDALTAWLRSKGVPASAQVQAFSPTGATAALVIGDPRRPDFTAERAEVGYGLRGLTLEVRSVRLVRPVLRARLHDGQLSAGALDPLIEAFRKGPPQPNARQPRITVEGGVLLLATDYGPVRIDADATVDGGRLDRLVARTAPAQLRSPAFAADLGAGALSAQRRGDRLELSLDAPTTRAAAGAFVAENARLRLTAAGPYPDLKHRRGDGAVVAHAELAAGRLAWGGQAVKNGLVSAAFTGQAAGWIDDFALAGRAVADLRAASAEAAGGAAGPLSATASAEDLRWTRKGGDAVAGRLAASVSLDSFTRTDLKLTQVTAATRGPVSLSRKGAVFDLTAHTLGRGAWTGLGAPAAGDSAEIAAVKRAARGFHFAAPALALRSGGALAFVQPVLLIPDGGGEVALARQGQGWRLTAAGGGLPRVDANVSRFALTPAGALAAGRIKAALSIGPVEQGVFDASGALRIANGAVSFTGDRCADIQAARLNFVTNDARRVSAKLCPADRPLLTLSQGDWRIVGRVQGLSAEVPFLQAKLARAAGPVDLGLVRGELQARMTLAQDVSDTAPATRFRPVVVSGEAQLAHGLWRAQFGVRDPAGRPLAALRLRHETTSGRGGVDIDTGVLRFAPGGLQPAELSPLAATVGSPAEGEARFTGAYAWAPAGVTSSGVLELPRLDFQSPAGRVSGLSGRVVFSSLAPLIAAPGQTLQAQAVATPLGPITDARVAFGLEPGALTVSGGQAAVGGGLARIETLEIPLVPGKPMRGVLNLEGVQLHDLVEASPFGDRVELDAKVSGRIPFEVQGDKIRVTAGSLHAIAPGRLSIQRTALAAVAASGEVAAPGAPATAPAASTDTFTDFAYQAMENLSFTTLQATVDSRPDSRLGVLFHIVGEHDPPQHQEIRLSISDLIGRKFLGRQLPLPSGTGVDLTLDTTLNLDDLLADYADFRRLHGSATVQP